MKVMVAIDESQCSYQALRWVLNNLKEPITKSGHKLFLFAPQALSNDILSASLTFTPVCNLILPRSADVIRCRLEQTRKISLGLLEKAESICETIGINTITMIECGDPGEAICKAVENYGIDMLVIGSPENGILEWFFHGSLNNYCLKNAKCPVLVVKKED